MKYNEINISLSILIIMLQIKLRTALIDSSDRGKPIIDCMMNLFTSTAQLSASLHYFSKLDQKIQNKI